jgi:hypothetical protein
LRYRKGHFSKFRVDCFGFVAIGISSAIFASLIGLSIQIVFSPQTGLQTTLPKKLIHILNDYPHVNCEPGYLLTFCDRNVLEELRKDYRTRKNLENLISPNHIFLPMYDAYEKLKALERKNLLPFPQQKFPVEFFENIYNNVDQNLLTDLLILAWYAHLQDLPTSVSTTKLEKLINLLPPRIANLALQQAESISANLTARNLPEPVTNQPDIQMELIDNIREAIISASTLTILYRSTGQSTSAIRKVSPIMLEKRGGYFYLIAFCEQRCARRTFRLDRLQIINDEEI